MVVCEPIILEVQRNELGKTGDDRFFARPALEVLKNETH